MGSYSGDVGYMPKIACIGSAIVFSMDSAWGKDYVDSFYWYFGVGPDGLRQGKLENMWWPVRVLIDEV